MTCSNNENRESKQLLPDEFNNLADTYQNLGVPPLKRLGDQMERLATIDALQATELTGSSIGSLVGATYGTYLGGALGAVAGISIALVALPLLGTGILASVLYATTTGLLSYFGSVQFEKFYEGQGAIIGEALAMANRLDNDAHRSTDGSGDAPTGGECEDGEQDEGDPEGDDPTGTGSGGTGGAGDNPTGSGGGGGGGGGFADIIKNPPASPLVLDMDGDGIELINLFHI